MSDVQLLETVNGGEIQCVNGQIVLSEGLETAAFLSLFGGNSDDAGQTATDSIQWWGNLSEADPANRYRGELQFLLNTLPLIPANLQRFEEAAAADLSWMTDSIADDLAVAATMPALNRVDINVAIVIDGKTTLFTLTPLKTK